MEGRWRQCTIAKFTHVCIDVRSTMRLISETIEETNVCHLEQIKSCRVYDWLVIQSTILTITEKRSLFTSYLSDAWNSSVAEDSLWNLERGVTDTSTWKYSSEISKWCSIVMESTSLEISLVNGQYFIRRKLSVK